MAESRTFNPPKCMQDAYISSFEKYKQMYDVSVNDPETFWSKIAQDFHFKKGPDNGKFLEYNFDVRNGPIFIKWMQGAVTNVCYNALDRHIIENGMKDEIAFYWEGNDPEDNDKVTYGELLTMVCKFANVLKSKGVKKGDRVAIYMPMNIEIVTAMLACVRIGAVHSVVFGGFSAHSMAERIMDAECKVVVTSDGVWRGPKLLNLKQITDGALEICSERGHEVTTCIVNQHVTAGGSGDVNGEVTGKRPAKSLKFSWTEGRDVWWHDEMARASEECEPEWLEAEEPLFMLYTSGSTGKPKGVLHTQAGYMLYATTTFKYDFDYHRGEVYWCTADVGWITGHSYVCYGPLCAGATSVIFEGTPFYPDPGRWWAIVEKYKVSKFYTAPTAIRALMKYGEDIVRKYDRSSLKVLGTVGEPINPEAWLWYHRVVGDERCAVVDTFWQTETGGHTLTPIPGATVTKPGSATFPFFGIVPAILSEEGKVLEGEAEGYLVFKQPWPGIMRTVYGNHQRFETTYFKKFPGWYTTGDGVKRDADGYLWITGRIDDMLNVSGHLLSTAEVESALLEHAAVSENAVVARPHPVKGEALHCFVTMKQGCEFTNEVKHELVELVRSAIGPFATPDYLQEAPGLPKTRSGKIMRRVLRKIAVNDHDLGDVSTMADDTVVDVLFNLRPSDH